MKRCLFFEGFVVAVVIGVVLGVLIGAIPLGFVYLCLKRFGHLPHRLMPYIMQSSLLVYTLIKVKGKGTYT